MGGRSTVSMYYSVFSDRNSHGYNLLWLSQNEDRLAATTVDRCNRVNINLLS